MALTRVGNGAAHARSWSTWARVARTRLYASSSSVALIATAVWDALWGSTPMITCMGSSVAASGLEPRWALLLRVRCESSHEPRRGEVPTESPFVRQPNPTLGAGRPFVSYLDRDLLDATNRPQRPPEVSSRHIGATPTAPVGARYGAARW